MTIPLYGSSTALFPRLGRLGRCGLYLMTAQTGLDSTIDDWVNRYTGADEFITGNIATQKSNLIRACNSSMMATLTTGATATLLEMVREDQPARVNDPISELIRQMIASGDTVQVCTVAASASADGANTGNGTMVMATARGDGRTLENIIAETARIVVTQDSRTGGTTVGGERFRFQGTGNTANVWDWDWPQGSGAFTSFQGANAKKDFNTGTANLLRNSDFDTWTAGTPTYWAETGTVTEETSLVYGTGGSAAKVAVGGTGALLQTFNDSTGTTATVKPLQSIAFAFWVRGSAALSGGTVAVALVDGSGTTLLDDLGASQSVSFTLNGVSTTYVVKSGTLRTPRILPSAVKIRITITVPVGGDAYVDHFAASNVTAAYPGGPGVAAFAGSTAFALNDGWTAVTTNNRGGASYGMTWQTCFGRLFGTLGTVVLPSSNAPTILDSLLTS